jgi:Zn finger protein HypA/HybF involved in hydrogenase expression
MGQAKLRGNKETRMTLAKARLNAIRPVSLTCNTCKGDIHEVHDLDVRHVAGIEGAFAGVCPTCKSPTYAIKGTEDAVSKVMVALEQEHGSKMDIGVQPINKRDAND